MPITNMGKRGYNGTRYGRGISGALARRMNKHAIAKTYHTRAVRLHVRTAVSNASRLK